MCDMKIWKKPFERRLRIPCFVLKFFLFCRSRIWTCDFGIMSPTSYQTALSCDPFPFFKALHVLCFERKGLFFAVSLFIILHQKIFLSSFFSNLEILYFFCFSVLKFSAKRFFLKRVEISTNLWKNKENFHCFDCFFSKIRLRILYEFWNYSSTC